jgi:hypothetical protein
MTRRSLVTSILVGAATLCLFSSTSYADDPRAQSHDGFLLRLSMGPGFASTTIEGDSSSFSYSGSGADINLAIGGMVAEDVAIHATIGGWSVFEPEAELTMGGASIGGQVNDVSLGLNTIGAGVTTYFAGNFYFSGSLGLAILSLDDGSDRSESDEGVGVDLTFGKEWWVSKGWGLGVAGGLGLHSVPGANTDNSFQGGSLGVRFSATYN